MKGTHLGEFEELILLIVALLRDEAYGVAIREEFYQKTGRKVTISTVHSALHRLETKGFLEFSYGEATAKRGGRRKKMFRVTVAGESALSKSRQIRENLWNSIHGLIIKKA